MPPTVTLDEKVLAEAGKYTLRQYVPMYLYPEMSTGATLISVGPEDTSRVKKVVIYATGYPGDAIETGHALGRELVEKQKRDEVITVCVAYRGVISQEMLLGGTDFNPQQLNAPLQISQGDFTFQNAVSSVDDMISALQKTFPDAEKVLIGNSYGGLLALDYLNDRRLAAVVFLNPVVDVVGLNRDYDVKGLLEYGVMTRRIRADSAKLLAEPEFLAKRFNPLDKRIMDVDVPVFIYRGLNDRDLPFYHVEQLAHRLLKLCPLEINIRMIPKGDHGFSANAGREELFARLTNEVLNR